MSSLLRVMGALVIHACVACGDRSDASYAADSDAAADAELLNFIPCSATPPFPPLGPSVTITRPTSAGSARGGALEAGRYELRAAASVGAGATGTAATIAMTLELGPGEKSKMPLRVIESADGGAARVSAGTFVFNDVGEADFQAQCGPPSMFAPGLFDAQLEYTSVDAELTLFVSAVGGHYSALTFSRVR